MNNTIVDRKHDSHLSKALWSFRSFQGDPVEAADRALEVNPELVAAHILRACALFTTTERIYLGEVDCSIAAALRLFEVATESERSVIQALQELSKGNWSQAECLFEEALRADPDNMVALQTAHILDFMRGDAISLRNRIARVLPMLDSENENYSFVLGMYAFGLEECNEFTKAEEVGRRAIELNVNDVWATHAVAHVMEMQGRSREGVLWLADTSAYWKEDNGMACHNWWHKALFHLELGEIAEALEILDTNILVNIQDMSLELVDVSSLLVRLKILGVDVDARANDIAQRWRLKLEGESGYYAFNDFHCALAFATAGDLDELQHLKTLVTANQATAGVSSQWMNQTLGLPLIDALCSYTKNDMRTASKIFDQSRKLASGFGGSNAQRDVIAWLYQDACEKSGDRGQALRVVNERLMAKPGEQLATLWQARLAS